jgi:hypothetical protein
MCTLEELQPALRQAAREYFVKWELPDAESQIVKCCETISERKKTNFLTAWLGENDGPVYYQAAFFTPERLFWGRSRAQGKPIVVSAKLKDIFVKSRSFLLLSDAGLDINGFVDSSFTKIHGYISMGLEPAAEEFCKAAEQAVDAVHKPRRLMDIFGKVPD